MKDIHVHVHVFKIQMPVIKVEESNTHSNKS